jgi:hypothetical protein
VCVCVCVCVCVRVCVCVCVCVRVCVCVCVAAAGHMQVQLQWPARAIQHTNNTPCPLPTAAACPSAPLFPHLKLNVTPATQNAHTTTKASTYETWLKMPICRGAKASVSGGLAPGGQQRGELGLRLCGCNSACGVNLMSWPRA